MEKRINYKVGDKVIRTRSSWGFAVQGNEYIVRDINPDPPYGIKLKGSVGTFIALGFKKSKKNRLKLYRK